MSVLITSDQTMFIETSANFYLPGEGSNNRQGSDERVGGSVRVNTYY